MMSRHEQLLESIDNKLGGILKAVSGSADIEGLTPEILEVPGIIEVKGMEADYVLKMLEFEGKHEVKDKKCLQDFLGFNPNDRDPDGKAWCAGFLKRVLEECGINTDGLTLMATSFKTFGCALEEIVDGAILVFEPSEEADFPIRHVGVAVDNGTKLFGGNQGNSAKRSNLDWYLANAELTAIRCPEGYKLVA